MLTLANLICGSLAVVSILTSERYGYTFMLIVLAAVFDFFDGFVARLFRQSSPVGAELDSLADVVSFGLAPALVMMSLYGGGEALYLSGKWAEVGGYIPLIIVAFSALRLAKFNIDTEQTHDFIGLPTPACALFCASLGLLYPKGVVLPSEAILLISVVMAYLLILPMKMFSLKFYGYCWRGNEVKFTFLAISLILLAIWKLDAIVLIIPLYVVISMLVSLVSKMSSKAGE